MGLVMSGRYPSAAIRDLVLWAAPLGWSWKRTGSGHIRWDHASVSSPVFTACTPHKRSGTKEERAKLRRALARAEVA